MNSRSIRSFALDYYRKQGAEIRPLDEGAAYEIVPADGSAIRVTFTGDADTVPLTSTSPQWRAILEDLTSDLAVSYRYLVTGPIANPAQALTALVPRGWEVKSARFQSAESRQALGVTHRVTFDSPALNVRQELLSNHVWDLETDERMPGMEPMLYQVPSLLLRPETRPDPTQIQALIDRSMGLVDRGIDIRGSEIETELGELLAEAEKRTNQYFEQQMNNVLQREVLLTEKLDAAIKKLSEAKTPEAVARYRQDGEVLARQLESLKARREQDLAAVEAACQGKLTEEREKHELTATTDLVALCHATYDVLTYRARVADPEGREIDWELRFWPVQRKLELPACPYCFETLSDPRILANGDYACAACTTSCAGCGDRHATGRMQADHCATCRTAVCASCSSTCVHCATAACTSHELGCTTCEAPVCGGCARYCATCEAALCHPHAHRDAVDAKFYCSEHYTPATPAVEPEPEAELQAEVVALLEAVEPVEAIEAVEEAPAIADEVRHWARTEPCHACGGEFEVQDMVDCSTCGVPTCHACGDVCPACDALEPIERTDARLAYVFQQFPELAKAGRRWQASQFGPYVVTMWTRMGWWGMVVYHVGGPEPVKLSDFSCGPVETARTRLKVWLGGRR